MYRDTEKRQRRHTDVPGQQGERLSPVKRSEPVHQLHHSVGNQTVMRLFQSGDIQAKLKIGAPSDKYEQEADRIADSIFHTPLPDMQQHSPDTVIRTKSQVAQILQPNPGIDQRIDELISRGRALEASTREFMEPRFGRDFSQVRIHTDQNAASVAQSLDARAFTYGNNIVFNSNQYDMASTKGKHLLSHELVHVIQQANTRHTIQREPQSDSAPNFSCPSPNNPSCWLTEQQRIEVRRQAGNRIDRAYSRFTAACMAEKQSLKDALASQQALVSSIVGTLFSFAMPAIGKVIVNAIDTIPNSSPDWITSVAIRILDNKELLIDKPLAYAGKKATEAIKNQYRDNAIAFIDNIETLSAGWAQQEDAMLPNKNDDELVAGIAAWDAEYTSKAIYSANLKELIKRFRLQVDDLDKHKVTDSRGVINTHGTAMNRAMRLKAPNGITRLALVEHRYSTMYHNQRRHEELYLPQYEDYMKKMRSGEVQQGSFKPEIPAVIKGDELTFLQWIDADMVDMAIASQEQKHKRKGEQQQDGSIQLITITPDELVNTNNEQIQSWLKGIEQGYGFDPSQPIEW